MRSIALFLFILCVTVAQSACSGKPAGNADAGNGAESAKESPFAYITDPNVALAEGNRLFDDNQTEMAIEAYKQAIHLDPDIAEAHFKLGIAYALIESEMQQSGIDANAEAGSDGKKAPGKPNSQKEFEKAVAAYKKLLDADPKNDVAQFNLGRAYNKLNKDDDAEDAFRAAVKLKPDDTEYQTELGAILIKLAKYHEAIPPLKKALELDPENSRAEKLQEDAEAGAKRIDFAQVDKDSNKKANANANVNANSAANSNSAAATNTATKPRPLETKPKTEAPRDKRPEKPSTKPNDKR